MIIFILILGALFILFNEVEDECVRSTFKKRKQFWNTNLSWKNKWLWVDGKRIPITKKSWKWLWIWTPEFKERKYLYSTAFVFLTDGEHLMQLFKFIMIELALLMIGWEYMLAWIIGKSIAQLIKELIKWIR